MTGTLIAGKYEVIREIGGGGQGKVYQVRDPKLDAVWALKSLNDPALIARFKTEGRVMAQLRHQNIVKVVELIQDGDSHYLKEEFIEGRNLTTYLKEHHQMPLPDVLEIACQLGGALAYAHSRGVIHRDVKPSNVLIEDKPPLRALLIDFGVAKVNDVSGRTLTENDEDRTQPGSVIGTLAYAAPEQLAPDRYPVVDGRADVWALGQLIYEMCEGAALFAGLRDSEIIGRVVWQRGPLELRFRREVPENLRRIVARALCRDPADRYPTMDEMLADLESCRHGAPRDARPSPRRRFRERLPGWRAALLVSLAAIALPIVVLRIVTGGGEDGGAARPKTPSQIFSPPPAHPLHEVIAEIQTLPCSNLTVKFESDVGEAEIQGRVESEEQRQQIVQTLRQAPEVKLVHDQTTIVPRPFCEVMEILDPVRARAEESGRSLSVHTSKGCNEVYHQGDSLAFQLSASEPLGYIYVDYYGADGTVTQLYPEAAAASPVVSQVLRHAGWKVGPPFGMEMVTIISNPEPLPLQISDSGTVPLSQRLSTLRETVGTLAGRGDAAYCLITTKP